jgi:hypothetical protein
MIPKTCLDAAGIHDPDQLPSLAEIDLETAARLQVGPGALLAACCLPPPHGAAVGGMRHALTCLLSPAASQSAESKAHGGKTPRGGVSALAQVGALLARWLGPAHQAAHRLDRSRPVPCRLQSAAVRNEARQQLASPGRLSHTAYDSGLGAQADQAQSEEQRQGGGESAGREEGGGAAEMQVGLLRWDAGCLLRSAAAPGWLLLLDVGTGPAASCCPAWRHAVRRRRQRARGAGPGRPGGAPPGPPGGVRHLARPPAG